MKRPHVLSPYLSCYARQDPRMGGELSRPKGFHVTTSPHVPRFSLLIPAWRSTDVWSVMPGTDAVDPASLLKGGGATPSQSPSSSRGDGLCPPRSAVARSPSGIHSGCCPDAVLEETALAPRMFHLLQLLHRGGSYPVPITSAHLSRVMTMLPQTPSSTSFLGPPQLRSKEEEEGDFRQLHGEVCALGELLRTFRSSHPRPPIFELTATASSSHSVHCKENRRAPPTRGRALVQLMATPTDAEEVWLLPLQREVVTLVLQRLHVMGRVCKRLAGRNSGQQGDTCVSLERVSGGVTAFFREQVRVAGELVALCGAHERDALPLTCLIHVLTAAADAGVAVSAATLVGAAATATAQHDREGSHCGGSSVESSGWCSCVPWLLLCYITTCAQLPASLAASSAHTFAGSSVSWSTAGAWMTAAADRVCATQSAELLQLAQKTTEAHRRRTAAGIGPDASVKRRRVARAHTFGLWQSVLDSEGANKPKVQSCAIDTDDRRHMERSTCEEWLRNWYAKCRIVEVGTESNRDVNGTWHPYWQLVVKEMVRGCARAVEALLELSAGAVVRRRSGRPSEKSCSPPEHVSTSLNSTCATLKEVQFYAIGCYVCLRRITSSLQRHRCLGALLQLHAMVSGFVDSSAAVAEALPSQQSPSRSCEGDDPQCTCTAATNSLSMWDAARWRFCLLSGVLLEAKTTALALRSESQPHRHCDDSPLANLQLRHQAGAMLWREVALLDAYTLITIGHVSEHAVDGEGLSKKTVLDHLAWLQKECALHLTLLEGSGGDDTGVLATADCDAAASGNHLKHEAEAIEVHGTPPIMTRARRSVLLQYLTPRTRAGLIDKLQEGLRLSAKALARWGTPEQICALYLRYPSMGSSWEVGRALLQCGHYSVAVEVLESLLRSNTSVRGVSALYRSTGTSASPLSLRSSNATAVRQLLLEAIEGAAAALVQQSWSGASPDAPASSNDGSATGDEIPLSAELRARLYSLYVHLHSLPVPLPLCLHAIVRGLTSASSDVTADALHDHSDVESPSFPPQVDDLGNVTSQLASSALPSSLPLPYASAEARTRATAVLCTYVLRCHLAEKPHEGLLAKTVELWASRVALYLGRGSGNSGAEASPAPTGVSLELSVADRYLCAMTTRLLCGYPQLPVARLLLSRLVQQLVTSTTSSTPSNTTGLSSSVDGGGFTAASHGRVARAVVWLLGTLYMLADAPAMARSATSDVCFTYEDASTPPILAYRLCVPLAAAMLPAATTTTTTPPLDPEKGACSPRDMQHPACGCVWNAGYTERYALDTLRLMPRIALEALERLLRSLMTHSVATAAAISTGCFPSSAQQHVPSSGRCVDFLHDRVSVILKCRRAEEEDQRHPWQCSTCYLWNSRYARACKRCKALSTVLLQCRRCGCLTSSADDRGERGLNCDVCRAALVPPLASQGGNEVYLTRSPPEDSLPGSSTMLPTRTDVAPEGSTIFVGCHTSSAAAAAAATAATVTGTGRAVSRFSASANIARVLPLRQWTCAHCRSLNDPQHFFFCRVCGQATTDPEKRDAATSAAGEGSGANNMGTTALGCECCGHRPRSIEARVLPWCEQCGILHKRIRELCEPSAGSHDSTSPSISSSRSSASATEGGPRAVVATGHPPPYLWWCVECTVAFNPWTRTHCELCGAGRPLASLTSASVITRLETTGMPSPASPEFSLLSENYNVASPLITVPWRMQVCSSCKAQTRVGMPRCWQCQSILALPLELRQALSKGWWWWVTQVTRLVMDHAAEGSKTQDGASASSKIVDAPLRVPLARRWLCLHDGCMSVNINDGKAATPIYHNCAACAFTPRNPLQLLSPFHDRFAWGEAAAQFSPTNAAVVVEGLLLPSSAPWPGDIILRRFDSFITPRPPSAVPSDESSAEEAPTAPQSHVQWLHHSLWSDATTAHVCVSCGEKKVSEAPPTAVAPLSEPAASCLLRLRSLFMVNVCLACGWCSWGRSSCAYDVPMASHVDSGSGAGRRLPSHSPPLLLPGEHAMSLRLLLRALAHAVQEGVLIEVVSFKPASSTHTRWCGGEVSTVSCSAAAVLVPDRRLDWAWLSRFVFSGVRLVTTSVSEVQPSRSDSGEGSCTPHPRCCLHERLPWRGCDLASSQQTYAAERRMGSRESSGQEAGAVHSAMVDVRHILDGVCTLVEHRVKGSAPRSRSPQRRHCDRRNGAHAQLETPAAVPLCLRDAWSRRLLIGALDLLDLVNASTFFDEIGFSILSRLCLLFHPHGAGDINAEAKWAYLQEMKLCRSHVLQGCVKCEQCLTSHEPYQGCAPP